MNKMSYYEGTTPRQLLQNVWRRKRALAGDFS